MRLTASTFAALLCLTACAKRPPVAPAEPPPPVEQVVTPIFKAPKAPIRVRNVLFAFDSDTVSKRDAGRILRDCLTYPGPRTVAGYASSERSGKYRETASVAYNLALSARRANAVRLVYTVSGCPDVQVEYFGETQKFNKKRPEINRRVTVR